MSLVCFVLIDIACIIQDYKYLTNEPSLSLEHFFHVNRIECITMYVLYFTTEAFSLKGYWQGTRGHSLCHIGFRVSERLPEFYFILRGFKHCVFCRFIKLKFIEQKSLEIRQRIQRHLRGLDLCLRILNSYLTVIKRC